MILFAIMATGLFIYYVIRLLTHPEENRHTPSGRYYDAFPTLNHEEHKPHYPKPNKKELEKAREQARLQQEELQRKVTEYDKNHFFDFVNKRWVKQTDDGTYVSSCSFRDWNMGLRDDWGEVEIGRLVTREKYYKRQEYYDEFDEDYDEFEEDDDEYDDD